MFDPTTDKIIFRFRNPDPRGAGGDEWRIALRAEWEHLAPNAVQTIDHDIGTNGAAVTFKDDAEAMFAQMALHDRIDQIDRVRKHTNPRTSFTYRHNEDGPAVVSYANRKAPLERFFLFGLEMMNHRDFDEALKQGFTNRAALHAWRERFYAPGVHDELRGK